MTMQAEGGTAWMPRRAVLAAGGAAVLAALGFAIWGGIAPAPPAAPVHAYHPVLAAPSAEARALAERLGATDPAVLELRAAGEGRPLARIEAGTTAEGGRVLLGWRSLGQVPILRRDIHPEEELRLIEALARHLPEGSAILAMPALSRRLAPAVAAAFPLEGAAEPLALPPPWRDAGAQVAADEAAQWGPATASPPEGPVAAFLDALLAEDVSGAARLRVLAGMGEAYVLVHLEDAFHLGQLRTPRLAMARRGFASGSFSHDLAREARSWGQANGHAAWAVDRAPDGSLRGHYLTEAAETATLIAQLLPFNTSRIDQVAGLRLVWQAGGYWLYRLAPLD